MGPRAARAGLIAAALVIAAGACRQLVGIGDAPPGSVDDAGADALAADAPADTPDAPVYPAPHPPLPTILDADGGVITKPRILAILFPGYEFATEMSSLATDMGGAGYWAATVTEYGVGLPTGDVVTVAGSAPATIDYYDGVQQWLLAELTAGSQELGAPSSSTIYTIFFPQSTGLTVPGGGSFCAGGIQGYNSELVVAGARVPYAVVPHCAGNGLDFVTTATSGIWLSALTDPFPASTPAFAGCDTDHLAWQFCEVGNLCAWSTPQGFVPPVVNHSVGFAWSNAAAQAGHDPCVPQPSGTVYFNAAPVVDDAIQVAIGNGTTPGKGVHIPAGQSRTIDVDLFSDGPTNGPWAISARQFQLDPSAPTDLTFAFDRTHGRNGDVAHLTITVAAKPAQVSQTFVIDSTLGGTTNSWPAFVGN